MNIHFTPRLLIAGLFTLAALCLRADEEADLLAVLLSTAGAPQKCAACQKLRVVGTAKTVPALTAALLGDERVSHAARYALEGLPYPEAGASLREALGKTSGSVQAGVIDSLGWRREPAAAPLLKPFLSNPDAVIASAAAIALGRLGDRDAVAALSAVRTQAPPALLPAVCEGLLLGADWLRAAGDNSAAATVYRGLFQPDLPPHVRAAAWRGLVLVDIVRRVELVPQALSGTDLPLRKAALKLLREFPLDVHAIQACLVQWASLPEDSQLAVLDAHLKLGAEVLSTIRAASESPHLAVRIAAWRALADLNDPASVATVAATAARAEPAEREAARETLARLHGPGMRDVLLSQIDKAEPPVKAELLRALGARGDQAAADVLLKNAGVGPAPVRLAALESLRNLALPATANALLELAGKSSSDAEREPVLRALYAVCQASPDKNLATRQVVEALDRLPVAARRQLLPLLSELGTPAALAYAQTTTRDQDPELVKEAVRVLTQWPNAAPAPRLLELARASTEPTLHALALRGCVEVIGQEPDPSQRLAILEPAMAAARNSEDKKRVLGQLGQTPTPASLRAVMPCLTDPALASEAGLAAVTIAEKLAAANPKLATDTAAAVLARCKGADVVKRAWALRGKSASSAPFIQDWLVCGPYRQAGAVGAPAVFDVAFGPEKPGETVAWKSLPRAGQVDLSGLFPGQENCAAYLKAQVIAPDEIEAVLLLGSDDGVKAWVNGAVVHSNNLDRGLTVDQDIAPIRLKKGVNELLLKVSQGGGGWAVCARIASADSLPIAGLRVESQADKAPPFAK